MRFTLLASRKASFRYPIGAPPRTAILGPWFREPRGGRVRVFASGWSTEAAGFGPAAIVGSRVQLLELAAGDPPAVTHALIVIGGMGDPLLTAVERERLWRAFHVPVFEQIAGDRGELLAAECEAHDGLHIEVPGMEWTGYSVEEGLCACGRRTPRLSSAEPAERIRAAAFYAR